MTQKASRIPNATDRLVQNQKQLKELYGLNRMRTVPRTVSFPSTSLGQAGGAVGASGNFLPITGGAMNGPLALGPPTDFRIDIDANNTINIGPGTESNQYTSNIQIDDILTSATLDIIAGAAFDGQILILRTFAPPTITIRQGTLANGGNIRTPDGDDVTIGDLQMVVLVFDEALRTEANTGGTWRLLNTFGGGDISGVVSVASLGKSSSQLAGVVDFDLSEILGPGIVDEGNGVFKLSGAVFQLNSSILIEGTDDTMLGQWQRSSDLAFTTPLNIGRSSISITYDSSASDTSGAPISSAFVDATAADVYVRLFTTDITGTGSITVLGTWGQIFSLSGGSGSGGGLSEPIILGINELSPQTLPTTTPIAWDTKNPQHIILDRAVELSFSSLPANGKYEGVLVIIDIDGVGGFDSPIWPASVVNPPVIPTGTPNQRFSVMLYTIDGGTVVTHATSVGSSTGGEFFGPWTANHNAGLRDLTNLKNIDFDDALSTIFGLVDLQWFQAGHEFTSVSGAFNFRVDTLDKFNFFAGVNSILEIDDTTGLKIIGSHVLNMGNNIINSISELQLSNLNVHTPSNELSIAFDTVNDALKYSVALTTDVHQFFANTDLLASISRTGVNQGLISVRSVVASDISDQAGSLLQTNGQLFILDSATNPASNGQFRRNGDDVKVFTGGLLVNLSDVGSPNEISQGDSFVQVIDSGTGTVITHIDGAQKYSIQATRADYNQIPLHGLTEIHMHDIGANPISTLTAGVSSLTQNILGSSSVYDIQIGSIDAFHVDTIRTRILSTSPNILAANLSLFRDDSSPTVGDEVGLIKFDGRDSATAFTTYAELRATIDNVTSGSKSANFFINLKQNNFDVDMLRIVNGVMILRTFNPGNSVGANFTLLKEDSSPGAGDLIGNINWNVLDSPTESTYARIQTLIQDATDAAIFKIQLRSDNTLQDALIIEGNNNSTQFQLLTSSNGNTRIQPASTTRIGYFVTPHLNNFSVNIGTAGTLEIPQINDGSPSLNDLNAAFGAFDGAMGQDINDGKLYIRKSSTTWSFYNESGTVP